MARFLLLLAFAGPVLCLTARAQLTIKLKDVQGDTSAAPVYVAGSFNGWDPASEAYRLTSRNGFHEMTLPKTVRGTVEFKFTRGSWESVETDGSGKDIPNRSVTIPSTGATDYEATVGGWRDGSKRQIISSARPSVFVMAEAFEMPELRRSRRVWVYLPPDYHTSERAYPVLYMHDGQNVFDDATSFAGEWGVDETLDEFHAHGDPGIIVVAIDHGEQHRIDEYSPYVHSRYGGGEGDAYLDFLVTTLKPHIDARFRTRPDRLNTGIAGSSMGGLISLYATLKHPEVFGRAGVFSPALWIAPEIFTIARRAVPMRPDPRIYFVSGALESAESPEVYMNDQRRMIDTLNAAGFVVGSEVDSLIADDGEHAEWFWRREFPAAYRWLFGERSGRIIRREP